MRGETCGCLRRADAARHQTVVWWAGSPEAGFHPWGGCCSPGTTTGVINHQAGSSRRRRDGQRLGELAAAAGACIAVEDATGGPAVPWVDTAADVEPLEVAVFGRELDQRWSRTSYSGITAALHGHAVVGGTGADLDGAVVGSEPRPTC